MTKRTIAEENKILEAEKVKNKLNRGEPITYEEAKLLTLITDQYSNNWTWGSMKRWNT